MAAIGLFAIYSYFSLYFWPLYLKYSAPISAMTSSSTSGSTSGSTSDSAGKTDGWKESLVSDTTTSTATATTTSTATSTSTTSSNKAIIAVARVYALMFWTLPLVRHYIYIYTYIFRHPCNVISYLTCATTTYIYMYICIGSSVECIVSGGRLVR